MRRVSHVATSGPGANSGTASHTEAGELGFPESTYLVDTTRRLVYLPIPKVACTSLKTWFVDTSPDADVELDPASFKVNMWLGEEGNRYLLKDPALLTDPSVFRFCFVRNPWSRLVSAYLNRIVGRGVEYKRLMRKLGRGHWYRLDKRARFALRERVLGAGWSERAEPSFRDFVFKEVAVTEPGEMDPHWRPQCDFLGRYELDFVGRFERLREDLRQLSGQLGISEKLPERNRSQYASRADARCHADRTPAELRAMPAMPRYRQFYTPELVEAVGRVYAEDIDRFGYEF